METTFVGVKDLRIYCKNAEQKTTVVCFQTCYTSLTEGTICGSIWKDQQPPTVFLHDTKNHKYWTAVRHYARYRSSRNVMSAANSDDKLSGSIMRRILK